MAGGTAVGSAWQILQLLIVVALVAGAALFTTRFLGRRFTPGRGGRRIEVVETAGLGPKTSLCLARVDGRNVLIGVTEHQVTLLVDLDLGVGAHSGARGSARPAEAPAEAPARMPRATGEVAAAPAGEGAGDGRFIDDLLASMATDGPSAPSGAGGAGGAGGVGGVGGGVPAAGVMGRPLGRLGWPRPAEHRTGDGHFLRSGRARR